MDGSNKRALEDEERVPVPRLLYALLGGPIAWSLHLLTSYFLVALACTTGWSGVRVALAAVTVIFGAAAVGAGVVAYRTWRRFAGGQPWETALAEPRTRSGFFMVVGMVLSALFAWIIVLAGLPPLFVPMCASGSAVAMAEFPPAGVLAGMGFASIGSN